MEHGKAVAERLRRGHKPGGIPWMVILDADGKELVTSDGPTGNIGCPVKPAETAWFVQMIQRTAGELTDEEVELLRAELEAFASQYR